MSATAGMNLEKINREPIPKAVMTMAVPTVLSQLVMVFYNMADTFFVGMLNQPVENAAVTLAAPLLLAFNAVNNLFGVGCSSLMSRALGEKKYERVRQTSVFGIYCSILCGALISLLCLLFQGPLLSLLGAEAETRGATAAYMNWTVVCGAVPSILNVVMAYMVRSEGAALHASIGTMTGCLLNILLDPLFILPGGFAMGAGGAGLATFLSNCVACVYFAVLLFVKRGKTFLCVDPRCFRINRAIVLGVCGVGIPASVQNLLNVTGMTVLNNLASGYGPDAVAAMGISQKIYMVPFYVAQGLSQGIMPLISYNYARKNYGRMKKTFGFTAKAALCFLLVVMGLLFWQSENVVSLFIKNETVIGFGTRFLRTFCMGLPFLGMDFLAVGVFQACGFGSKSLLFAILRKVVLEIPGLMLFNTLIPLYGLPCAQPAAELILAAAAVIMLRRIFRRLEKAGPGDNAEQASHSGNRLF